MKRLFLTLFLFLIALGTHAQIRSYIEYDYNRSERFNTNLVVASDFRLPRNNMGFSVGFQLGTQGRYALNIAYQMDLLSVPQKGTFYLENRYLYRLFQSYKLQEFNALLGLGWKNLHWNFQLGLCNRYIAEIPLRKNGGEGVVFEPMNVVFNIKYNLKPEFHPWNIGCGISNYREFIIERVTLFYYTVHGYYDIDDQWRLIGEAGLHPAGVLNLSSQYNGFFFKLGCTYQH